MTGYTMPGIGKAKRDQRKKTIAKSKSDIRQYCKSIAMTTLALVKPSIQPVPRLATPKHDAR